MGGDPGTDHIDDADVPIEGSPGSRAPSPAVARMCSGWIAWGSGCARGDLVGGGLKSSADGVKIGRLRRLAIGGAIGKFWMSSRVAP